MKIKLETWELEMVYQVGIRRDSANADKPDAAYYDKSRMEDNLRASVAAAACELAVAKATCCYWTASVWDSSQHYKFKNLPDVLPNLEVRRVRSPSSPLVIRDKERRLDRVTVLAYTDIDDWCREVDVIGWITAQGGWALGSKPGWDTTNMCREVSQELLSPIEDLRVEDLVSVGV